ncbi:MAG: hypothetical protein M3Z04_03915 [Chloroflexota bacterium]|nr:hypothetical protein [Chloroflexota bacterium]
MHSVWVQKRKPWHAVQLHAPFSHALAVQLHGVPEPTWWLCLAVYWDSLRPAAQPALLDLC